MNAVHSYFEVFLKSDRVVAMVQSGGCSSSDFREVFKNNIEKRVRSLPEIDGLSKETVLSSWMAKFDQIFRGDEDARKRTQRLATTSSEMILSKEQLYDMFQNILGVKKYEHQILYNAMQVIHFSLYVVTLSYSMVLSDLKWFLTANTKVVCLLAQSVKIYTKPNHKTILGCSQRVC